MKTSPATIAAITATITLMGLLAMTPNAAAEIVYTPVNVTVSGTGSIKLDLNHDGIMDVVVHSTSQGTSCGIRGEVVISVAITPTTGDGIVVSYSHFAAVLASGISIDGSATFYNARTVVAQSRCQNKQVAGYPDLSSRSKGQTHYGWMQVSVDAQQYSLHTTVIGFAHETTPGQAIKTGQTSGDLDDARIFPPSAPPYFLGRTF